MAERKRKRRPRKKKIRAKLKGKVYVGNETVKRDIIQNTQIDSLKKQLEKTLQENAVQEKKIDSLKQVVKIRLK